MKLTSRLFCSLGMVLAAGAILCVFSCRRSDPRLARIHVSNMISEKDVRIVTNAVVNEAVAQYDGVTHEYEVDLQKRILLYHEGPRLRSREYLRRIEACIQQVGFKAHAQRVQHNPPGPIPTRDGPILLWQDRHTVIISVPEMVSATAANRVVDAVAYARFGRESERVNVDPATRSIIVRYESTGLSLKNLEEAIACVGFSANYTLRKEALPHDWTPIHLCDGREPMFWTLPSPVSGTVF